MSSFKLPEDLSTLTPEELAELHEKAVTASLELSTLSDEEITDEQLAELEVLAGDIGTIEARQTEVQAAADARTARLAAARGKVDAAKAAKVDEEKEEEEPKADEEPSEDTQPVEVPDDASSLVEEEEKEPVTAAAKGVVAKVAKHAPTVIIHDAPTEAAPTSALIASANVPGYDSNSEYADMTALSEGFMNRARAFEGRTDEGWDRYGVAKIRRPEGEFVLDPSMSAEAQTQVLQAAMDETRLPGGSLAQSALTAAVGGWCAPSETSYDFCPTPMPDDLGSYSEVTIRRGGMRFTKGPDITTMTATWGFLLTEAQVEAGTAKVCYEIACPPFEDVRLDAVGFCVTAGLLTNAAYPELVRDILAKGTILHRLKVDKYIYDKIKADAGAAINFTEIGSATGDILSALELNAEVIRAKFMLPRSHTVEVLLPSWARGVIRQDLSFRTGVDLLAVTDADIARYFSVRGIAVQYLRVVDPITTSGATTGQAWPTTVNAVMYPAGSYVVGRTPVIDLDTVYDSAGLTKNQYTAAFFEEGILVANTCWGASLVAITATSAVGETGAANLVSGP